MPNPNPSSDPEIGNKEDKQKAAAAAGGTLDGLAKLLAVLGGGRNGSGNREGRHLFSRVNGTEGSERKAKGSEGGRRRRWW